MNTPRTRSRAGRFLADLWRSMALAIVCCVSAMISADAAAVSPAPLIGAIRFEGNQVTRDSVLRQQLLIHVGQPLKPAAVEASRQAIMNLGLFVRVEDHIEPMAEHRVAVVFSVKEKTYTWGLPRIGRSIDGDISYGGQLEFDNLLGLNQRLKLIAEQKRIANGGLSDQQSVEYSAARLPGSAYGVSTKISSTEQREFLYSSSGAQGEYQNNVLNINAALTRWLRRSGPNNGWSAGVGIGMSWIQNKYLSGAPGLVSSGRNIGVSTNVDYTNVSLDGYGYRRGVAFGVGIGGGGPFIGSDYNEIALGGYLRHYQHLAGKYANLNYQLRFGFSSQSLLRGPAYTLGGANTLRGYVRDSLEGNAYVLANIEYLHPVFGNPLFRGVLFTDLGNAWYRGEPDAWRIEPAFGAGLRWHIQWLVDVNLRVDAAYAVGQKRYQIYVGSNSMF